MNIAPIDIAHKKFSRKVMGGLEPEEVSIFLKQISDEMENLIAERNSLRQSLRERELAIIEYKERDELLKSTITTATKMSDNIRVDSERESKLTINDAKQKAESIVRDARDSLKRIYLEITDLKKIRMQFENNLRALVQSHLTMVDQAQNIMPSPKVGHEIMEESFVSSLSTDSENRQITESVSEAVSKATQIDLDIT